jgi:sensor c-di-GMP phosphodiesterase-like protein
MKQFVDPLLDNQIMTSIDDFGTGYSSLGFLRELPVRELKIDRSFINHPTLQEKDEVIIGTIISMAKELGVDVITEGVETKNQVDFLLKLGCKRAQGFLYDCPLTKERFEDRLVQGRYEL